MLLQARPDWKETNQGELLPMIRAALVGVSGYGRWHLLMAIEQMLLGRVKLVGVTVINPQEQVTLCRRITRQGIPVFATFDEMMAALAGRVDLLLLPTGIQWHAPMTLAGLRAGAHVLVEKPAAATMQEVDAMMHAQVEAGRLVAIGFQELYVPGTHDIKRRVLARELGSLRRIVVRGQWPRSSAYYARNGWAGQLRVNGAWVLDSPANNAFAHFLMMALFWAGATPESAAEIDRVEAELYRAREIASFDTVSLRLQVGSGVEILFYASHAGEEEFAPEIELCGDNGSITWTYEHSYFIRRAGREVETVKITDQLDTRLSVMDAVIDRIEGRDTFIVEPGLAREHTRLVNAMHEFFPIHTIGPDQLEVRVAREGISHRIRGLDASIRNAVEQGRLFSEIGVPWAKAAPGVRSLQGYQRFSGVLA